MVESDRLDLILVYHGQSMSWLFCTFAVDVTCLYLLAFRCLLFVIDVEFTLYVCRRVCSSFPSLLFILFYACCFLLITFLRFVIYVQLVELGCISFILDTCCGISSTQADLG